MPSLRERLEARARRIELETVAAIEGYISELDAFLYKQLTRFYAIKLSGVKGALQIKELPRNLKEAGLEDKLADISGAYSQKISNVKEDFAFFNLKGLDVATRALVVERVSTNILAIQNEINTFVGQTQKAALSQLITNNEFDFDKFAEVRQTPFLKNLTGMIDTDLNGFEREIGIRLGESLGVKHYYYSGTLIKTSRPFCIERAGRVFSIDEINAWPPQQGLPANVYLGGYNCRHRLSPVSDAQSIGINKVVRYG
jgi:hypothetical protein